MPPHAFPWLTDLTVLFLVLVLPTAMASILYGRRNNLVLGAIGGWIGWTAAVIWASLSGWEPVGWLGPVHALTTSLWFPLYGALCGATVHVVRRLERRGAAIAAGRDPRLLDRR